MMVPPGKQALLALHGDCRETACKGKLN